MQLFADFAQDARYTLRQLRRAPMFSLTVIATMALALGITSAMTGVLRATLLNPLPYPQPDRLVEIADTNLRGFKSNGLVTVLRAQDLAEAGASANRLFASTGYFYSDDSSLTLDGHPPVRVPAVGVSGGFFPTLAATPLLGRTLGPADDIANGPQLLVISDRLWQTAFAADPAIIGRAVRLGPAAATIVGVMPPRFAYPAAVDLWHPGHVLPVNFQGYRGDNSRFVQIVARLQPAATLVSARAQASQLAARLAAEHPDTDSAWTFTLTTLRASLFGEYRQALLLLACAVGLVLLVAAINVAGLQLSRNAGRAPEFALRGALGITRARLVRQLVTESLLLVLLGTGLGLLLAPALLRVLASRMPAALLRLQTPHVDTIVILLSAAVSILVALLTSILPALQSTRNAAASPARGIVSSSGRGAGFGRGFAVLQIALSLVLLTLSTAVLQGLYRLIHLPLGFQPTAVLTFTIDLPWGLDPARTHRVYSAAQQALEALPGVTGVAAESALPLSTYSFRRTFDILGQPVTPHHDAVVAEGRTITPAFLNAMQIPLLAGRELQASDALPGAPPVIIVNLALAHRYFPNGDALGHRLNGPSGQGEIVGIVGDVRGTGGPLTSPPQPELYSIEDGGWPHMQFILRSNAIQPQLESQFESQVRKLVVTLDSSASAGHFTTLSASIDRQLIQPRLNAALLTAFAALSLLLVVIGVYGLFAFELAQRTHELGLRLALGSSRAGIRNLVLARSLRILAVGLLLGLAGSVAAARLLAAALTGAHALQPVLLAATVALVSGAVLLATLIPARRAAHLDPIQTLKAS